MIVERANYEMINDINHSRVINQTCVHSIGQGGGGGEGVVKEGGDWVTLLNLDIEKKLKHAVIFF